MKKTFTLLLGILLVFSTVFTGGALAEEGKMDKLTKIVVCVTCNTNSPEIGLVQDAINEISVPAINVEVELRDVTIVDALYASYFTLAISSGETMDLIQLPYVNVSSYADSMQIEPIGDLLQQYAPDVMKLSEEYPILDACSINGEVYGVDPVMRSYGSEFSVSVLKEYMDETGISPDKELYTLEDLTEIFAAIKEKHPEIYPFTFATLGSSNFGWFGTSVDALGATGSSGVLLGTDSTTIVNMYATEEYKNFIATMRAWYEAGFMLPDAATTDLTATDLLISGKCVATQQMNTPDMKDYYANTYGGEVYSLPTNPGALVSTSRGGSVHWCVPTTSDSPEAATRFLNLMYTDARISQLLYSGIEGKHYVDKGDHIEYPEGVTYETVGYQNSWDIFGDTRTIKYFTSYDKAAWDAYTQKNLQRKSKGVGYAFDATPYVNEIMAIDSIVAQYVTSLETGSVKNYEETIAEMLKKMEAAGINRIIEANQASFDKWLSENQ